MKRWHRSFYAFTLGWALTACSPSPESSSVTKAGGRRVGALRGLQVWEEMLNERLLKPHAEPIDLHRYLDPNPNRPTGLVALLGAFTGTPGFSMQEKAGPNAVNTLLWEIVSARVSRDLAGTICQPENKDFDPDFYAAAHSLCEGKAEASGEALKNLWMRVMRYDAPEAERDLWAAEEMAADGLMNSARGEERVARLIQSILMNPYFMLEH